MWAKAEQECSNEAEMISIIGHLKNPALKENSTTIFAIVTSQFLGVKDHFKLLSLSKRTSEVYLQHNYHAFLDTLSRHLKNFNLKYRELQDSF